MQKTNLLLKIIEWITLLTLEKIHLIQRKDEHKEKGMRLIGNEGKNSRHKSNHIIDVKWSWIKQSKGREYQSGYKKYNQDPLYVYRR